MVFEKTQKVTNWAIFGSAGTIKGQPSTRRPTSCVQPTLRCQALQAYLFVQYFRSY